MDVILANPPYNIGGQIIKKVFEKYENAEFSILMPASCYLKDEFYKNIKSVDSTENLFEAAVQKNNLICTLQNQNNNWTEEDFFLQYCDQKYRKIYEWNIKNFKGLIPIRCDGDPLDKFDIDLDFIEHARAVAYNAGNGFGSGGAGYFFNVVKDIEETKKRNLTMRFYIHFDTKEAKDNFSKWWYSGRKMKSLSSQLMTGTGMLTLAKITKYAIPQIDWNDISKSRNWVAGKYDDAVLSAMKLS